MRAHRITAGAGVAALVALAGTACTTTATGGPAAGPAAPRVTASAGAAAEHADPTTAGHVTPTTRTVSACPATLRWGTGPRDGGTAMTASALTDVRAGRHECFDRLVFDIAGGDRVGYVVRYVPVVRADGSGAPVPVRGRAALEVIVRAPIAGTEVGAESSAHPPAVGANLVRVAGWASLRQVAFAGSFEGQTTVAVGVREHRPFRVFTIGDECRRRVVLDVSH